MTQGEAESWGCSGWGRDGSGASHQCVYIPDEGWCKEKEADSSQRCSVWGQEAMGAILKFIPIFKNIYFYCLIGQIVEQVAQRGCGISILEDIQNMTGHGLEQSAVADSEQEG